MPFSTGLVTVTFRKLEPREIVQLAKDSGISWLEWGGDVHVPPGQGDRADEVRRMTEGAGVKTLAYGSYFRVGESSVDEFPAVIDTALKLNTRCIRVWAGRKASVDADDAYRRRVVDDSLCLAEQASAAGLVVAYEFHANTLTDTAASALELLRITNHPAIRSLWQAPTGWSREACLKSIETIGPWLQHVHVYYWPQPSTRGSLEEGADTWRAYLQQLQGLGLACPLLLEFVMNDEPEQFRRDAAVLQRLLREVE